MKRVLKYPAPVAFSVAIGLLFLFAGWLALNFSPAQRLVPFLIIVPGFAVSLLVVIMELRAQRAAVGAATAKHGSSWRSDAVRFAWIGLFVVAATALGFLIGLSIAVFAYGLKAGARPLTAIALTASAVIVVLVFDLQFQLRFPTGLLFELF